MEQYRITRSRLDTRPAPTFYPDVFAETLEEAMARKSSWEQDWIPGTYRAYITREVVNEDGIVVSQEQIDVGESDGC